MPFYRSSQFVPGKGTAWTYYEAREDHTLVRMMTHIPETGEITLYPEPVIKRLFRPEALEPVAPEEFEGLWTRAEKPA